MTRWITSSHSGGGNGSQCVEIALTPAVAYLRDSKNATGPTLRVPTDALAGLVALARGTSSGDVYPLAVQ